MAQQACKNSKEQWEGIDVQGQSVTQGSFHFHRAPFSKSQETILSYLSTASISHATFLDNSYARIKPTHTPNNSTEKSDAGPSYERWLPLVYKSEIARTFGFL